MSPTIMRARNRARGAKRARFCAARSVCFGFTIALAACSTGGPHPTTALPMPPADAKLGPTAPIIPTSGPAQRFIATPVADKWWLLFGDATLNTLVDQALAANNDIATADAALRQSREQAIAAGAARFPTLDAGYQAQRTRISGVLSPPLSDPNATEYTLHTSQLSISYALDVFGGVRNKIASARAAAEVQRYKFEAARTTVISNLVLAVIQNASLDAQIEAANANVASNREVLRLLHIRQNLGLIGTLDIAMQEAALATAEATLPPLLRAQAHTRAQIAALTGVAPGHPLPPLPTLDQISLPPTLPVALPSELVAHRPDVRAAKAAMEGAAADVGAAIAARLPAIQLSASYGGSSTNFADMFATGNPFYTVIGSVTQPLFHAGALKHTQRAFEAAFDGSKAQYRAAALQSFVDVADALTALKTDADLVDSTAHAQAAARKTLGYVTRQLQLGDVGALALLNAQSANAQAASALIQARTARYTDCVALIQALGGGWRSTVE